MAINKSSSILTRAINFVPITVANCAKKYFLRESHDTHSSVGHMVHIWSVDRAWSSICKHEKEERRESRKFIATFAVQIYTTNGLASSGGSARLFQSPSGEWGEWGGGNKSLITSLTLENLIFLKHANPLSFISLSKLTIFNGRFKNISFPFFRHE